MEKLIPLSTESISYNLDFVDISKCLLRGFRGRSPIISNCRVHLI